MKRGVSTTLTILALALSTLAVAFAWMQFQSYEDGMIEVYAEQQDDIVKLAASTLSELDSQEDSDMVDGVSVLNMSHGEYWTLAKNDELIFVKDRSETNRYKGLSDISYFEGPEARAFITSLDGSAVRHAPMSINGSDYIVSGYVFESSGNEYELCQLTLKDVVTNNNSYMTARVNLWISIGVFILLFLATTLFMGSRNDSLRKEIASLKQENAEMYLQVEELDNEISSRRIYDVKHSVFEKGSFASFYERLVKHDTWPTTFFMISPKDEESELRVLSAAQELFDQGVLRFRMDDGRLLVAFISCDFKAAKEALAMLGPSNFKVVGSATLHGNATIGADELIGRLESQS